MRFLIIKLGAIGDVIRTTCILRGLKEKYSGASIDWLTQPNSVDILRRYSLINTIYVADDETLGALRREQIDFTINLEDGRAMCEFSTAVNATEHFGAYIENNTIKYTDSSAPWFDMSLISKYGKKQADELKKKNRETYPNLLFRMLDIRNCRPPLVLGETERKFGHQFFERHCLKGKPTVGLNTGAGGRWKFKKLSENKTIELANSLATDLGANVLLFGGELESERNRRILERVDHRIIDAGCRNNLLEFAALIKLCDVLVTSDSLALHIGYSLDVRLIAFFGPTSMAEIEITDKDLKIAPQMDCLCCYKNDCDFEPNCMDNIQTSRLFKAVKEILFRG